MGLESVAVNRNVKLEVFEVAAKQIIAILICVKTNRMLFLGTFNDLFVLVIE